MFLKKKSPVLKGALFITASMIFAACGSDSVKEDNISNMSATQAGALPKDEAAETMYSLPSPLQIASIFKKSGLKYKDGVTSTMKDPSRYVTIINKATNLGIYSADLSYAVLNKQNQEAMTYMKLSRQVADKLGVATVFDQGNLAKRFEKNLSNEDSLAYIIAELQMATDMYLDENDQQQITAIVFAGAWIESMYIGSKVYEKGDKLLNNKLAEQMTILDNIINALKSHEKKDAAIAGLVADLKVVKDIYDALPSVKNNPVTSEDIEKELTLTDDEVAQLTTKIEAIRLKFING